jgi:hypothetical protein
MQHYPQPQESPDRCLVVSPSAVVRSKPASMFVAAFTDLHGGLPGMQTLIRETQDGDIQQLYFGEAGTNLRRKRKT